MAITYHAGRRLQATSTDFGTAGAGIPAVAGGWKELGRTTLSGSATSIDVSSLADKRYLMVLYNMIDDGSNSQFITNQFGNGSFDTGSNYAERRTSNGAADATATSASYWNTSGGDQVCPEFTVQYLANKSDKEKLGISHSCGAQADGAGTAPNRREHTGKWANTSNVIDRIRATTAYGSRTYGTDSEVVVLGWDDSDTHTTNFWEELASVNASGSSSNLSTGTFTAKKYLWIQYYVETTSTVYSINRFNNDTTATYAWRNSSNGGGDSTTASDTAFYPAVSAANGHFCNMFIVNNSANEKLVISHTVSQNTAGATAPQRREGTTKWANTSSQITEMDIDASTGNWGANSIVKVWGSN
tara:strand:+ start:449 stop:1522 length:1074 start_codon:yes stop_codon:yes gene_type:complete